MQINKVLTAKEKKIRKREKAKLRRKMQQMNTFSFQNEMVDLVSQRSNEEAKEDVKEIVEEQPESNKVINLEENVEENNNSNRNIKISHEEYYLIVEVGKFYRIKKDNEKNINQISILHEQELLFINGKDHQTYSTSNSFIFCAKRENGKSIKFEHFSNNFSQQVKEKVTKSMINLKNETFIKSNSSIQLEETTEPWANLPKCIEGNDSLLFIGVKNTGKSTLAEYLLNSNNNQCVLLDCDIGRNSSLEGCVSLTSKLGTKKIWIGELTPLNNLQTYIRAIRYLFQYYNQNWFTKKLIINTMGYLTGLGEFLLYEIYQIVKPKSILILQSRGDSYYLKNIISNFKTGRYVEKLFVSRSLSQSPSSTNIFYYQNVHCFNKKSLARFQKMFEDEEQKVSSIVELLQIIRKSDQFSNKQPQLIGKDRTKIDIYEQSRHGKEAIDGQEVVSYRKLSTVESVDMRLVVLGKMIEESSNNIVNNTEQETISNLFEVNGLGFGLQGKIYYKPQNEGQIGIVNEGMDFEKGFYHLNEKQLIDLQLRMGRLNFIQVATKGLGSKGMRNNPSKMA